MGTMYEPADGVFVGRPPCGNCHAAARLHVDDRCPEPAARGNDLTTWLRLLADAMVAGDRARVFTYRGEVQRLMDHRPVPQGPGEVPHCAACNALRVTANLV